MTSYVIAMTNDVRGLKAFLDSQAASTREEILTAITRLRNPQPHEIKRYLDSKVEEEIEQECKKGKIDYIDKDRFLKKYNVTLRTIHRWLRTLSKEGLLDHVDSRYSLSDKFVSDIRYSGQLFLFVAAIRLFEEHKYTTMRSNVRELIAKFGLIVFYMFIEAARPITDKALNDGEKVRLIYSWLENSIPIRVMFDEFLDQYDEFKKSDSFALNERTIDKLSKVLREIYPNWYTMILRERKQFSKALIDWDKMKDYKPSSLL